MDILVIIFLYLLIAVAGTLFLVIITCIAYAIKGYISGCLSKAILEQKNTQAEGIVVIRFMDDLMKTCRNLGAAYADYRTLKRYKARDPDDRKKTVKKNNKKFAFNVHPRDEHDIFKPFPIFRYLPYWALMIICTALPPIKLSNITGVKNEEGHPLHGFLFAIVWLPEWTTPAARERVFKKFMNGLGVVSYWKLRQLTTSIFSSFALCFSFILSNKRKTSLQVGKQWAKKDTPEAIHEWLTQRLKLMKRGVALRGIECALLAEARGAGIIGLGAWLPSICKYGKLLKREGPLMVHAGVTTGHAYTSFMITQKINQVWDILDVQSEKASLAVIGAAGSTGSATIKSIASQYDLKKIVLVDLEYKRSKLQDLQNELETIVTDEEKRTTFEIKTSSGSALPEMKEINFFITVTNAPYAIFHEDTIHDIVGDVAVIVDDSQPPAVPPRLARGNHSILLVDTLCMVSELDCNFPLDLLDERPEITFTCLGEVIILAKNQHFEDFSIGYIGLKKIHEIARLAEKVNIDQFENPILTGGDSPGGGKIIKVKKQIKQKLVS